MLSHLRDDRPYMRDRPSDPLKITPAISTTTIINEKEKVQTGYKQEDQPVRLLLTLKPWQILRDLVQEDSRQLLRQLSQAEEPSSMGRGLKSSQRIRSY